MKGVKYRVSLKNNLWKRLWVRIDKWNEDMSHCLSNLFYNIKKFEELGLIKIYKYNNKDIITLTTKGKSIANSIKIIIEM